VIHVHYDSTPAVDGANVSSETVKKQIVKPPDKTEEDKNNKTDLILGWLRDQDLSLSDTKLAKKLMVDKGVEVSRSYIYKLRKKLN